MTRVDLSVCILSWNTKDLTFACLDSIKRHTRRIAYEIILVDNGSHDGVSEGVRARYPEVKLIRNETNIGFTRGNNQALRESSGRYVILLNNDTEIEAGCFDRMVELMDADPAVGMGCCRMVYPDRSLYLNIHDEFPGPGNVMAERTLLSELLPGCRLHNHYRAKYTVTDPDAYEKDREIAWGLGAFLMARREVVERIGLLDEAFFIFFEEIDWCRRCVDAGWKVKYYAEPVVVHHTARSIVQEYPRMSQVWHHSRFHYFAKHHGLFAMLLLKLLTATGIVVRLGKYAFQAGRAAPEQAAALREMAAAYRRILRMSLFYPRYIVNYE